MVKIYPNGIVATQGDTIRCPITVKNDDGTIYKVQDLDSIKFHLKENYEDAQCLIENVIDNDELMLVISHEQTQKLEVGKTYIYDIKITKENGDVSTFAHGKLKVSASVCSGTPSIGDEIEDEIGEDTE